MNVVLALDWNGTVVDDDARVAAAVAETLGLLGVNPGRIADPAYFRECFRLPLTSFFVDRGVASVDVPQAVSLWNAMVVRSGLRPRLMSGAGDLLQHCGRTGIPVHVVSGAAADVVSADLHDLLPDVSVAGIHAPAHPKREVLDALGGQERVTVFLGDTVYDMQEGLAVGAIVVGVARAPRQDPTLREAGAHLIVRSLAEVIPLLKVLGASRARPGSFVSRHAAGEVS